MECLDTKRRIKAARNNAENLGLNFFENSFWPHGGPRFELYDGNRMIFNGQFIDSVENFLDRYAKGGKGEKEDNKRFVHESAARLGLRISEQPCLGYNGEKYYRIENAQGNLVATPKTWECVEYFIQDEAERASRGELMDLIALRNKAEEFGLQIEPRPNQKRYDILYRGELVANGRNLTLGEVGDFLAKRSRADALFEARQLGLQVVRRVNDFFTESYDILSGSEVLYGGRNLTLDGMRTFLAAYRKAHYGKPVATPAHVTVGELQDFVEGYNENLGVCLIHDPLAIGIVKDGLIKYTFAIPQEIPAKTVIVK